MIKYFGVNGEAFPEQVIDDSAYFGFKLRNGKLRSQAPAAFHCEEEMQEQAMLRGHKLHDLVYCSVSGGFYYSVIF
jgi:hypothetical protein